MRTFFVVISLAGLAAVGCASATAKAPVDRPALVMPPPPPRVIEPAPEPLPEPVSDIPAAPPATPAGRPGRPRDTSARSAAEAKPDPKAEAPKPVEPIIEPVAPPPAQPPPQLRTPETADSSGATRIIRATIERTRLLLNSVDYGPLNNERKKAYNDAKLFLVQAEDGLKQGNDAFAQGVATKAETLARELASR
jgi:hypothetical protein